MDGKEQHQITFHAFCIIENTSKFQFAHLQKQCWQSPSPHPPSSSAPTPTPPSLPTVSNSRPNAVRNLAQTPDTLCLKGLLSPTFVTYSVPMTRRSERKRDKKHHDMLLAEERRMAARKIARMNRRKVRLEIGVEDDSLADAFVSNFSLAQGPFLTLY